MAGYSGPVIMASDAGPGPERFRRAPGQAEEAEMADNKVVDRARQVLADAVDGTRDVIDDGLDEARNVAALASTLSPKTSHRSLWQSIDQSSRQPKSSIRLMKPKFLLRPSLPKTSHLSLW